MYNVIPEMGAPPMNARYYGEIMNLHTRACWEVADDYYVGMTYFCYEHKIIPKNDFALTTDGLLRYRDRCVGIEAPVPFLRLAECPSTAAGVTEFGRWSVVVMGPSWGQLRVSRVDKSTNEDVFWCIAQVCKISLSLCRID